MSEEEGKAPPAFEVFYNPDTDILRILHGGVDPGMHSAADPFFSWVMEVTESGTPGKLVGIGISHFSLVAETHRQLAPLTGHSGRYPGAQDLLDVAMVLASYVVTSGRRPFDTDTYKLAGQFLAAVGGPILDLDDVVPRRTQ